MMGAGLTNNENAQAGGGEETSETPFSHQSDGNISRQIKKDNCEYLFNQINV